MSTASPDVLLEKLCSGDDAAAKQAFLAHEPYLRMMVRRRLSPRVRPKSGPARRLRDAPGQPQTGGCCNGEQSAEEERDTA
jgi:hypothetical protein